MPDFDDLLNQRLNDLENGVPLENVLNNLPVEAQDLAPLIRLAAAVRSIPHPEPLADRVSAQRQQVMAAAIRNTQPIQQRMPQTPPARRSVAPKWKWLGAGVALSAAGAMVVLLALVIFGASLWLSARNRNTARVEAITGQVQVATDKSAANWKNIAVGYRVQQGDHLRTLGASTATLAFFEGTHTVIAPNSDLTFSQLHGGSGNTIQVRIDQTSGETANKVTPFGANTKSTFLVQTPSGTASVHGTIFNVKVGQNGLSTFAVTTGVVRVQNESNEVTLNAGQATSANTAGVIATPTYQFSIQGSLTDMNDSTKVWTVSGLQFQVASGTEIDGVPQLGDTVNVSGRIMADQTRVADSIEISDSSNETAYFTGTLEKNTGDIWQVSGTPIKVTADTEMDQNPTVGDPVKVSFNLLDDGTYLALKIESLVEQPVEPTPAPTLTSDPNAAPGYAFVPATLETSVCGSNSINVAGALRNTATNASDYAANVQLGYLIDEGGDYVDTVDITPTSIARIDAGQSVNFNIHVTTNSKWSASSQDAQIKLRIFITSATNRPDQLDGHMTVNIAAGCTPTPTGVTPSATLTPNETETPEATETESRTPAAPAGESDTQDGQCTGANPQPTGMRLAQRYGVSYQEIMGWFCQHYGFGEIDLAYSLSRQSGKPVAQIFAMRASGLGWGQIKKQLAPNQKHPGNDDDQGENNNSQGNDNGRGKDH